MTDTKHQYCSQQQKDELVNLVTEDRDLVCGKFSNKFTNKDAEKKWIAITSKLNSIPGGSEKLEAVAKGIFLIYSKLCTYFVHCTIFKCLLLRHGKI